MQAFNKLNKRKVSADRLSEERSAWTLLKCGKEKALLAIYDLSYDQLYSYGYHVCKDIALTEDCIQDIFLELWEKRNKLPDVKFVKAYLLKILKRKLLQSISSAPAGLNVNEISLSLADESMEDLIIDNENSCALEARLQRALNKLTKRQREIISLKFFNNLSYDEIAAFTGLSQQRIYNLVHDAVHQLRSSLFSLPRHVASLLMTIFIF